MAEVEREISAHRILRAKENLEIAKELFSSGKIASSISHSYYSMFHSARALLAFDHTDSKKHSGVIQFFNKNYVATGKIDKQFTKFLSSAFNNRIQADYHDFYVASKDDAKLQLENAEQFLLMIENYLKKILE